MANALKQFFGFVTLCLVLLGLTGAVYPIPHPASTSIFTFSSSGLPTTATCTTANRLVRTDGTTVSCAQAALATDVSGVLAIANGGTNKALTLSAGGIPYFDADSFEVLSAGNSGSFLTSGGSGAPTWTAAGSGTYAPTLTNGANVFASTNQVCYYRRQGSIVNVQCLVNIDPTSSGVQTILGVSLPVSSDLTGSTNAEGFCNSDDGNTRCRIYANAANDRLEIDITPSSSSNAGLHFTASYIVQ